jgi:ATP/maltotriose-dependent transcriptional regulator MalT/DNA-binding SARP family transcriptional activator
LLSAPVGIVEAPAGYGKSVLASELSGALGSGCVWVALAPADDEAAVLVGSIRRAVKAARLSDLSSVLGTTDPAGWPDRFLDALVDLHEPLLLVVDDAHHLTTPECAALVLRLASGMPPPHRMVVVARRLHQRLETLRAIPGAAQLTAGDIAFTRDETAQLAEVLTGSRPGGGELAALVETTGGWASAVVLAAPNRGPTLGPISGLGHGLDLGVLAAGHPARVMGSLVESFLGRLSRADRSAVIQLSHLPYLSPHVVEAVTGRSGLFDLMVGAGLPLARTATGWWEIPGPVAAHLARRSRLQPKSARAAAAAYAAEGDLVVALRLLVTSGLAEQAASLIESLAPAETEQLGWAEMHAVVEALGERALDRYPRILLHLGRVAETGYRMDLRREALERARRIVSHGRADPRLARELDAERARDLVWDETTRAEASALARAVIEQAGDDESAARARALDALGRLRSWWSEDGPHEDAEAMLEESARLANRIGQPIWAARALVPLAMGLHFAQCRYDRALAIIDRALALLPARTPYRSTVLNFRVSILSELGRFREAAADVAQMRGIAAAIGEEWLYACASWSDAELSSASGDREATVRAVLDVHRHRAAWFDETPGTEFLAQAAEYLDRVGEHQMAAEHLRQARSRAVGFERVVRVYEAAVLGRSGDPAEAEQIIAATLARPDLDPQERWPIMVLRAYAALRAGDPAAGALAASAFDTCRTLGVPEGPLRREPVVAEALLPVAAAAGSTAAADLLGGAATYTVSLLGGFELRRHRRRIDLPAGRPAKAVRAVAASGGKVHVEVLIEVLWPDVDLATGRNRLKNLLSRLRAAAGDVLVREGDMIRLASCAESDAALFEAEAGHALAAWSAGERDRAAAIGLSALSRYHGELLPADRYEPWASQSRERVRLRYLELLDLLTARAQAEGEVDDAIRLMQRAIDAEPYDEHRYVRLADLLASQGRAGSARAALRQARAALGELDLDSADPASV